MKKISTIIVTLLLFVGSFFTQAVSTEASSYTKASSISAIRNAFPPEVQGRAIAIARCESTLNPRAIHRNRNGTTDLGLFQLNTGGTLQSLGLTWDEAFDPDLNAAAAYRLYKRHGWGRWVCHHKV